LKTQGRKTFAQDKQSSRKQEDSTKLHYLKDSVRSDALLELLPRLQCQKAREMLKLPKIATEEL